MIKIISRFIRDEAGATAVEYGLLAGLVSLAAGGVVMVLGDTVRLVYEFVLSGVQNSMTP